MAGLSTVALRVQPPWDRRDAPEADDSIETTFLKYYLCRDSVITFL
jgi:hypothetical protein